jgi:hypothetical protein
MCAESTGDERLLIWPLLKRKVSLSAWFLLLIENREKRTELEFLDINLTTQVFCAMLFTVPYTFQILQHSILYSGFENPYKKIRETRKLKSIYE